MYYNKCNILCLWNIWTLEKGCILFESCSYFKATEQQQNVNMLKLNKPKNYTLKTLHVVN